MDEYRIIFKGSGKPISGYIVSDKMSLNLAMQYYNEVKEKGYFPELLQVTKVNEKIKT